MARRRKKTTHKRRRARRHNKYWIKGALGVRRRCATRLGAHHRKRCRVTGRHKGALHRMLGIPVGKKIPLAMLRRAAKAPGKLGERARFALNARRFKHKRRKSR